MANNKYKRVLLKISGEALLGEQQFGIDPKPVEMIADEIRSIYGVEEREKPEEEKDLPVFEQYKLETAGYEEPEEVET